MIDTPFFSGGNTELTAGHLNAVTEQLRRTGRLIAAPPLEVVQQGEGWLLRLAEGRRGFWARVDGALGGALYAWVQQDLLREGFADTPGGLRGGLDGGLGGAAQERGGSDAVPEGSIVWLEEGDAASGGPAWHFAAPAGPAGLLDGFWAYIDGEEDGSYGWIEAVPDEDMAFREKEGGRMASAGSGEAAVEASGQSGIPDGTLVFMLRPPSSPAVAGFANAASSPGLWGRLVRRSIDAVYALALGGTEGTFALAATASEEHGAPGGTTGELEASATAEEVQEALDGVAGTGNTSVSGEAGSFTITMAGRLRGGSPVVLSLASASSGDASLELAVRGRDLPFTDGRGRYSWVALSQADDGTLAEDPEAGGSTWPLGLATDAAGRTDLLEGTVAWLRPSPPGEAVPAEEAWADEALQGWEDGEKESHFAGLADADGLLLADNRYAFASTAEQAAWALLTGPSDGRGLYPFRAVHLGDAPPGDGARPELDEGGGFPEGFAEALSAALLRGPVYDDSRAAGDEGGRPGPLRWEDSFPGGRPVTGYAREVARRNGLEGSVVRVYARRSASTGELAWEFTGPRAGLLARIDANEGGGTYSWTEAAPPAGPGGEGGLAVARTGTAREAGGWPWVPAGSEAWLEPDNAPGPGWRFRYRPEGSEVRLVRYLGSGQGALDANPTAPEAHSGTVAVTHWPPYRPAVLKVGGYYAAFRAGDASYVVCQTLDYAHDTRGGLVSAQDQCMPGAMAFSRRLYLGPASAGGGPARPRVARLDHVSGTLQSFTMGQTALYDDGGYPCAYQSHGGLGFRLTASAFDAAADCYSVACGTILLTDLESSIFFSGFNFANLASYWSLVKRGLLADLGITANRSWLDGHTGTVRCPGPAGSWTDIVFLGGMYLSHSASPGPAPTLWSGTFTMNNSSGGTVTVTVADGLVLSIA